MDVQCDTSPLPAAPVTNWEPPDCNFVSCESLATLRRYGTRERYKRVLTLKQFALCLESSNAVS
jgi:hypothetical protein